MKSSREIEGEVLKIQGLGGKKTLSGEVSVNGAKNAALKAIAATVLFKKDVVLKNIPDIEDVKRIFTLLEDLGASVSRSKRTAVVSPTITGHVLTESISKSLRASVVLTGPVLARTGKVSFPHPGGCVIGARPVDLFIEGFKKMGARVEEKGGMYVITAPQGGLRGTEIFFHNPSVTATETFIMTAVLAKGKTVLKNVAMEPEIVDLIGFLNACGADISGGGTPTITIEPKGFLSPKKEYITPPDRIEAGSFLILGALAAKNLTIKNCNPEHIESLIETLRLSGVSITTKKNSIEIKNNTKSNSSFMGVNIKTHEYPGFPTDLQAPISVYLTQVSGESFVFETIFEGRLNYAESLSLMGAHIQPMDPHRIMIKGPTPLRGRDLKSPDLRAGLAFILAAIVAKGESLIHNIYNIDRGYENIEERLRGIGVTIERIRI